MHMFLSWTYRNQKKIFSCFSLCMTSAKSWPSYLTIKFQKQTNLGKMLPIEKRWIKVGPDLALVRRLWVSAEGWTSFSWFLCKFIRFCMRRQLQLLQWSGRHSPTLFGIIVQTPTQFSFQIWIPSEPALYARSSQPAERPKWVMLLSSWAKTFHPFEHEIFPRRKKRPCVQEFEKRTCFSFSASTKVIYLSSTTTWVTAGCGSHRRRQD